ncbi:hypothetical protein ALO74_102444 [Pseudomonas syringae pv. cunninghamiae]|uniref:Uncharacterized protein n=2 Tax=Pseudomonas syringae group pathovars incertae sedis TaxID=264449 RepID=A0A9X0H670_PSESX|nr:hypothetical protein ALO79_100660 [Pseudomonas syringae pv. castaneae]KPX05630.1 hypothetical protein ALO74_102444 [Pseudomonas syringae pv. cunninghamiae]KPX16287.1 hypothetical protein ALO73_102633 [Pseudomonas syringae pv. daphniphylli]
MANTAIRRERIKLTKPGWLDNLTGAGGAEDSELKKGIPSKRLIHVFGLYLSVSIGS